MADYTLFDILRLEPYALFLSTRRCENTRENYGRALLTFHRWLTDRRLKPCEVRSLHLAQFINAMKGRYSGASLIRYSYTLMSFYGYLYAIEAIPKDPSPVLLTLGLRRPQRNPRPLPDAVQAKLVKGLKWSDLMDSRASCLILLGLYEGLRRGEIQALEWAKISLEGGYFDVKGKGDKWRRMPMHPKVKTGLYVLWCHSRYHYGLFESRYVFRPFKNRQDRPMSDIGVQMLFDRAKKHAGLAGVPFTIHSLRHTFASRYAEKEGNPYILQKLLGHDDITTSQAYVKISQNQAELAYHRVFVEQDQNLSRAM
ncbi:MAG TPA: site-specific integrase [bacterium]|nr:site-specific integrase [bacterium]